MNRLAPYLLIFLATALAGCTGSGSPGSATTEPPESPSPPGNPSPAPGSAAISIEWDGRTVEWGAPERLVATTSNVPAGATIEWLSLDDRYLGAPVVLGTGGEITTSALKPGRTTIEAVIVSGGVAIARDGATVDVSYRERWNVSLEAHQSFEQFTVGDIWVEGDHALVARRGAGGISILSLDGGLQEVGRFNIDGLFTQEVKSRDGFAYVSHEGNNHPNAVTVVDIRNPRVPVAVGEIPRSQTASAHNLWIDGSTLYIAASRDRLVHVYDITNRATPRFLRTLASTNGTAHDIHVRDGIVYGSYLALESGQIGELVVASDEGASTIAKRTWPGAFTHSAWLSADGRHLYVVDEVVNSPVRIFDVSNPANPILVGRYQPRVGTIPHQFQIVDGERAYLANYKHGVEVIDVSDPVRPRLVGFYDTFPGPQADSGFGSGGFNISSAQALARDTCAERCLALDHGTSAQSIFNGAWGVHWTDDGRFVVSDMATGVLMFRFTGS